MFNQNYLHSSNYLHLDRSKVEISWSENRDGTIYLTLSTSMSTTDYADYEKPTTHYFVNTNINFTDKQVEDLYRRLGLFLSNRKVEPTINDLAKNLEENLANEGV